MGTTPADHPFATFIRILGKGPNLSRSLTCEETETAARMIMRGEVTPEQLGAFLCLLRVKTETPEEVCGFVRGIRSELPLPSPLPRVDLDWASWAGKARSLPYFLLSALALADAGVRIFMHGAEDHTAGRVYTSHALTALGRHASTSLQEACKDLERQNFAYVTLPTISPRLQQIMDLRQLLGVRSPLHTVGRKLNIFAAPNQLLSVTHPPYLPVHQKAAEMLRQPNMAIFKGDGGEAERRPNKPCSVYWIRNGQSGQEDWPPLLTGTLPPSAGDSPLDLAHLRAIWDGHSADSVETMTVVGTMAIVLRLLDKADTQADALDQATALWQARCH